MVCRRGTRAPAPPRRLSNTSETPIHLEPDMIPIPRRPLPPFRLLPTLLALPLLLAGCHDNQLPPVTDDTPFGCGLPATALHHLPRTLSGGGQAMPVDVEGVVSHRFGGLGGMFIQSRAGSEDGRETTPAGALIEFDMDGQRFQRGQQALAVFEHELAGRFALGGGGGRAGYFSGGWRSGMVSGPGAGGLAGERLR